MLLTETLIDSRIARFFLIDDESRPLRQKILVNQGLTKSPMRNHRAFFLPKSVFEFAGWLK
ncbi:hypothetical protein B9Z42_09120 [Limnohabitans sp. B9-3]|nr:hypothetical protein B9Z42_09120 [Limnohabitans sp. B9-3]